MISTILNTRLHAIYGDTVKLEYVKESYLFSL